MFIPLVLASLLQSTSTPPATTAPAAVQKAAPAQERTDTPQPAKGVRKRLKATLSAIDVDAMTIAFRDESGRGYTWPVNQRLASTSPARAAQALKTLVPGDAVWILYTDDDGPATIIDVRRVKPTPARDDRPQG